MHPPSLFCLCRHLMACALGLCLLVSDAVAEAPPKTGLLWMRSPLPAVFPLQIKTAPGHDYLLTLIDADTEEHRLAAYIEGGQFFPVLVPPGRYQLHFAYGARWRGETALFGDETAFFELPERLRFGTLGVDRKAGHLVDLRELIETEEASMIAPIGTCQRLRIDYVPLPDWHADAPGAEEEHLPPLRVPRFVITPRICG